MTLTRAIIRLMEKLYVRLEARLDYPDDHTILGVAIDDDLQRMSRRQLCEWIDSNSSGSGSFWELSSTTKIRFGCQLLRALK